MVSYIPKLIKNLEGDVEDKIMSLFKTNTTKNNSKEQEENY